MKKITKLQKDTLYRIGSGQPVPTPSKMVTALAKRGLVFFTRRGLSLTTEGADLLHDLYHGNT